MITRVIVCDDEPAVAQVTARLIARARPDLEVVVTTDPSVVLRIVSDANDAVALVTDYHLGSELTGVTLIELARQNGYTHSRAAIVSGLLGHDQVPPVAGIEIRLWSKPFMRDDVQQMTDWLTAQACP